MKQVPQEKREEVALQVAVLLEEMMGGTVSAFRVEREDNMVRVKFSRDEERTFIKLYGVNRSKP